MCCKRWKVMETLIDCYVISHRRLKVKDTEGHVYVVFQSFAEPCFEFWKKYLHCPATLTAAVGT